MLLNTHGTDVFNSIFADILARKLFGVSLNDLNFLDLHFAYPLNMYNLFVTSDLLGSVGMLEMSLSTRNSHNTLFLAYV